MDLASAGGSHAMNAFLRRLDRHWFAPEPLQDLALARVVLVALQLFLLLVPLVLGERGSAGCTACGLEYQRWLADSDPSLFQPIPALKLLMAPFGWGARPSATLLTVVWVVGVLAGILALIGAWTRVALLGLAAAATLLVAHGYSYGEFHHPQALHVIALWVLAMAPSGAALSLDAWRPRVRRAVAELRFTPQAQNPPESPMARWPLRLMQCLLALAYFSAALSKLTHGGWDWFNGYTLAWYVSRDTVLWGSAIGAFFGTHILLMRMISFGTIAFELLFFLAVLFPALAFPFVLGGIGIHAGIYLLQSAAFPQFVALYIVFIDPIRSSLRLLRRGAVPARWTVLYDGLCPLCIRSMTTLDMLDLRARLEYVDIEGDWDRAASLAPSVSRDDARRAMYVAAPDGRVYRGFFAFRRLAHLLPPLWPLLPIVYFPLAGVVGPWVYRQVAENRGRAACRADTCEI